MLRKKIRRFAVSKGGVTELINATKD